MIEERRIAKWTVGVHVLRRNGRVIVGLLLAGIVVSAGSAYVLLHVDLPLRTQRSQPIVGPEYREVMWDRCALPTWKRQNWEREYPWIYTRSSVGRDLLAFNPDYWEDDEGRSRGHALFIERRGGWPWRAVARTEMQVVGPGAPVRSTSFPRLRIFDTQGPVIQTTPVPLQPMWSGLLANAALFALVPIALWLAFDGLRTLVRVEHGRCVRCNYAVLDAERCPECGTVNEFLPAGASGEEGRDA